MEFPQLQRENVAAQIAPEQMIPSAPVLAPAAVPTPVAAPVVALPLAVAPCNSTFTAVGQSGQADQMKTETCGKSRCR